MLHHLFPFPFEPCTLPVLSTLLALPPATQRNAVPGVLISRYPVAIGICKDEGAPERTLIGRLEDGGAFRLHSDMQFIDLVTIDPERYAPSWMRSFIFMMAEVRWEKLLGEELPGQCFGLRHFHILSEAKTIGFSADAS